MSKVKDYVNLKDKFRFCYVCHISLQNKIRSREVPSYSIRNNFTNAKDLLVCFFYSRFHSNVVN